MPPDERGAALALLPVVATLAYYALPNWLQVQPLVQFAPQFISYLAFAVWATRNGSVESRFGLEWSHVPRGVCYQRIGQQPIVWSNRAGYKKG